MRGARDEGLQRHSVRLQEVTPRSYCLLKTIMAHTECVCDGVMCKHLCEYMCVCVQGLQGTVGVRLY